jgi:hypothetical protein
LDDRRLLISVEQPHRMKLKILDLETMKFTTVFQGFIADMEAVLTTIKRGQGKLRKNVY